MICLYKAYKFQLDRQFWSFSAGLKQKTVIWLVCQNMHIQISLGTKNYIRKNNFEMLD